MSLYEKYGYRKVPTSTYNYSSERHRMHRRWVLSGAVILLLLALVGIGILMIPLIAVTPRP